MSYEFRDFIFDFSKECLKQEQQNAIRRYCADLRQSAAQLSGEEREKAFQMIDEYEQEQMQNVERQASEASMLKEILKRFGV